MVGALHRSVSIILRQYRESWFRALAGRACFSPLDTISVRFGRSELRTQYCIGLRLSSPPGQLHQNVRPAHAFTLKCNSIPAQHERREKRVMTVRPLKRRSRNHIISGYILRPTRLLLFSYSRSSRPLPFLKRFVQLFPEIVEISKELLSRVNSLCKQSARLPRT